MDRQRKELGIFVVENPDGTVGLQAFESASDLMFSFGDLVGSKGRATAVALRWGPGGVVAEVLSKELPAKPEPSPWGTRLGVGRMDEPEDEGDGKVVHGGGEGRKV